MESNYNFNVEKFRNEEYPMLKDTGYLDHAGTTLYSKSLMERFMQDMMSNLYGNPHSVSASSQLSSIRIEDTRVMALQFFKADPIFFDLVFVANATAGIKLVTEAFQVQESSFNFGYHLESHTSLIGVRESAQSSYCWDDREVEIWLSSSETQRKAYNLRLFGYPAQSNMNGRRLPLSWCQKIRSFGEYKKTPTYTLLDASSLVSTAQLDLSNPVTAPDFTVLSFYKIFGFPDLGALILRKDSGHLLQHRRYFGGGTVDIVLCAEERWHVTKNNHFHESLEDGTLPIHNILALNIAIQDYKRLYGSMDLVSRHTSFLSLRLFTKLSSLHHGNSKPVCVIYSQNFNSLIGELMQGPIIAFNLLDKDGSWVSNVEFERLAGIRNFHVRTGNLCNPGGVAACLKLDSWELRKNFAAGFRCGAETDIYEGKIQSVIRVSLGAMSTIEDVDSFISFIEEFFVNQAVNEAATKIIPSPTNIELTVESLKVYPIKSCAGFSIPPNFDWVVKEEGLAWDREWLLVHQGTSRALSQKNHPRMALLHPEINFEMGLLIVRYHGSCIHEIPDFISVPLSLCPLSCDSSKETQSITSKVCGDSIVTYKYTDPKINHFFSVFLGVPCLLARFPAGGSGVHSRHSKAHLQKHQAQSESDLTSQNSKMATDGKIPKSTILLSNESPILLINRASLDHLNENILSSGGKPTSASAFRANVIVKSVGSRYREPYCEDRWVRLRIGAQNYNMLGSCRRCHMICIDPETAERDEEPFVTLAKTRRYDSKVFFGCHMSLVPFMVGLEVNGVPLPTIRVGDLIVVQEEVS